MILLIKAMKISALNYQNFYQNNSSFLYRTRDNLSAKINPSFGIANAGKLKTLFSYGLPCIYSGVEMIDPKKAQRLLKSGVFKQPASKVIEILKPLESQITDTEAIVYNIIKKEAETKPDYTLQEILNYISPVYRKQLRKKQAPIFSLLKELGESLPEEKRYKFKQFMEETTLKLQRKPVLIPFSANEFKYKLKKLKEDYTKRKDFSTVKLLNKMLKESQRFYWETNDKTAEHQKKVLTYLSVLSSRSKNEEEPVLELLQTSLDRINKKRATVPFSRKAFIYDLNKLLIGIGDQELKDKMMSIAKLLPTSRECAQAYITKFSSQPSEKIGYRLLWPNFASVEHILPKSCGGKDEMANFGGATTRENSDRQSIDFSIQIRKRPKTPLFCQNYVNRLIEYVKNGIFEKHKINIKYIEDFRKTIIKQSKGTIILNISDLYK